MKRCILFVFILLIFNNSLRSQNDFFPLTIGNQWNYSYKSLERKYFDISFMYQMTTDSGSVQYSLTDSSRQDSAVIWSVQENDTIARRIQDYYYNTDTTFLINVNTTFQLLEYLDSTHILKSESYYEVFTFPVKWDRFGNISSRTPITRFSRDSSILIIKESIFLIANFSDSLCFHKDIGLVYAQSVINKGPNTPYYYKWEASLSKIITSVNNQSVEMPSRFILFPNYPNPFNPSTTISFFLPKDDFVKLAIYNIQGQEVEVLINDELSSGLHKRVFNALKLASGIYFYKITTGEFTSTKKLALIK